MTHPPRPTAFSRLNDEIKDRIFQYAGREATFAYRIATGGREDSKQYIMKNAFYEPFTYWDWYNTDHTFKEADKRKRMLFRERERGYRANGKWSSYPSLKQRWEDFKKCMNAETRVLVKRIAVARWMEEQDLEWICSNLLNLEALDFSDLETRDGRMDLMDSLGQPRWRGILRVMQSTSPIPRADGEESPVHILKRLKWLGLSNDLRTEGDDAFSTLLRACENLQTLSLRAPTGYDADYWSDLHQQEAEDIHHKVCLPILRITSNAPDTVTTLELRHYLDFIPFFVDRLNSLKPSIKKVGIDLGAWVQVFPLRRAHKVDEKRIIEDEEIKENVKKAANWASEIGKLNKKTIIAEIETVEKGNSLEPLDKERDKMARKLKDELDNELLDREYTKKKRSFYRDDGGTCIHEGGTARQSRTFEATNCSLDGASHTRIHGVTNTRTTNTLPRMLKKLWTLRNKTPSLFALDPEPETRSLDPVNPLALVQMNDEVNFGAGTKYKDSGPDQDLTEVYQYLNVTFGWRPVFDWDWFMLPKHKRKIPDSAYERMLEEDKDYLARIEQQFRYLQGAGIPIHLLIGRCKEGHSSCYWQCPDSEKGWKSMVKQNYGAYLHNIAPLVDSLSIFYDLRNPEDSERLETIEALQPCKRPPAKCPQFPCPWGADPDDIYGVCPFRLQRDPLDIRRRNADDGKQKMANKAALHIHRPTDHVHLANSGAAAPPVGENASDYESEDSETDGIAHVTPLHELARTARYTCEGLGWNLFWAKNALKFTRLTMLRVRMPAPFEKTDSWRLAKLLDKKAGWELAVYTDERERVQAEENLIKTIPGVPNSTFEHLPEAKAWPGGRFVRRTWIWSEQRGHFTTDRKFGLAHLKDTDALEEQAREKALARAKSAIKRLGETEARLREEHPERVPLDSREKYRLYVHAVRLIAQEKWEAEIQERIDALQNEINRGIRDPAQSPQQEIQWLQQREREKVPIVGFEPQFDNLETGSDSIKDDIGWKDATSRSVDWIPRSWFDNLVPEYGFWEHLNAEGAGDPYQTPGTEPESYVPEEFRHNVSVPVNLEGHLG